MSCHLMYSLSRSVTALAQFLDVPPHVARTLPPQIQELIGYTMGGAALGYFDSGHRLRLLPDGDLRGASGGRELGNGSFAGVCARGGGRRGVGMGGSGDVGAGRRCRVAATAMSCCASGSRRKLK